MKLCLTINSGTAYLMSFVALVVYAVFIKAPFIEVWTGVASLYGWHTGRRLWRELKLPNGTTITEANGETK